MNTLNGLMEKASELGLGIPQTLLTPSRLEAAAWGPEIDGDLAWQMQRTLTSRTKGWHALTFGSDGVPPDDLASDWDAIYADGNSSASELESYSEDSARSQFSLPRGHWTTPLSARSSIALELPWVSPIAGRGGNLIALPVEYPGDVVTHLEWEGADNWASRTALGIILRRWYAEAAAVPLHLSDTDSATMIMAIGDLPKIADEVRAVCDQITVLSTAETGATIIELWWD